MDSVYVPLDIDHVAPHPYVSMYAKVKVNLHTSEGIA